MPFSLYLPRVLAPFLAFLKVVVGCGVSSSNDDVVIFLPGTMRLPLPFPQAGAAPPPNLVQHPHHSQEAG